MVNSFGKNTIVIPAIKYMDWEDTSDLTLLMYIQLEVKPI